MKTKLTFLFSLTFLFLFVGISEAGLRLLIAKKITKTILKILVDDKKERPLLHLVEGGKFASKKIKERADKGREEKEEVEKDYWGEKKLKSEKHYKDEKREGLETTRNQSSRQKTYPLLSSMSSSLSFDSKRSFAYSSSSGIE